jgi:pSer/pThr/pTyr-binding forkhead associated (FHA) protein
VASLIVRDGPLRGRRIEMHFGDLTLGREDTDLIIEDDTEVSRNHAVVRAVDGAIEIEDLGSTNGTFVNELKISGPTRLSNGDILRIGQTRLDVAIEDEDPNATRVSKIVLPPQSPTDLPIPVQRHVPEPESEAADAETEDSEMRAPTSELRRKVGGGAIQRAGANRGLLVAVAVVAVLVAGYFLYSVIVGGAPSKEDYVASVNNICQPQMSKLDNLNINRARGVERAGSLVNGMLGVIQELERPEESVAQADAFVSSFEKVGSALESLRVSQEANNERRARKAARRLENVVMRSNAAAKKLGATECVLRR